MSRYYGSLTGKAKTTATREGTTKSGISCHVRGWDVGVKVISDNGEHEKNDTFYIAITYGSNGHGNSTVIGSVALENGEPVFTPAK